MTTTCKSTVQLHVNNTQKGRHFCWRVKSQQIPASYSSQTAGRFSRYHLSHCVKCPKHCEKMFHVSSRCSRSRTMLARFFLCRMKTSFSSRLHKFIFFYESYVFFRCLSNIILYKVLSKIRWCVTNVPCLEGIIKLLLSSQWKHNILRWKITDQEVSISDLKIVPRGKVVEFAFTHVVTLILKYASSLWLRLECYK